ncbi:hypothetical protein DFH06DRAFT_1327602 [Mycena polygramma]|nr:hypothetical protein DFH06DRAFT_1327602 [Mycena polygramma]
MDSAFLISSRSTLDSTLVLSSCVFDPSASRCGYSTHLAWRFIASPAKDSALHVSSCVFDLSAISLQIQRSSHLVLRVRSQRIRCGYSAHLARRFIASSTVDKCPSPLILRVRSQWRLAADTAPFSSRLVRSIPAAFRLWNQCLSSRVSSCPSRPHSVVAPPLLCSVLRLHAPPLSLPPPPPPRGVVTSACSSVEPSSSSRHLTLAHSAVEPSSFSSRRPTLSRPPRGAFTLARSIVEPASLRLHPIVELLAASVSLSYPPPHGAFALCAPPPSPSSSMRHLVFASSHVSLALCRVARSPALTLSPSPLPSFFPRSGPPFVAFVVPPSIACSIPQRV